MPGFLGEGTGVIDRLLKEWKARAKAFKREVSVLYLALRHPRLPWHVRLLASLVVAYALSPVDLIPDFVPILGHLDDLVLIPLGIALVLRLIPEEILREAKEKAEKLSSLPKNRLAAAVILALWLALAGYLVWVGLRYLF
ncbi:YkvA family protein [Thermus antranikianii]|uniref:YkvA family protein n=1 Tax=Thermus antranikianii TaxID=88190 RepID=UPI000418FDBF|nr:YkvA family protein [Thermus antranikianii]